jgi:hypothetical protein
MHGEILMGVDYNVYIGPYVRATHAIHKKQIDRCAEHNVPPGSAFCPQCGINQANRFKTVEEGSAPKNWKEKYPKGDFFNFLYTTSCMSDPPIIKGKQTYLYLPNRHRNELGVPKIDLQKEQELPFEESDDMGVAG